MSDGCLPGIYFPNSGMSMVRISTIVIQMYGPAVKVCNGYIHHGLVIAQNTMNDAYLKLRYTLFPSLRSKRRVSSKKSSSESLLSTVASCHRMHVFHAGNDC